MIDRVRIFDTTLRDGEQAARINLNKGEKLQIARQLARLGVDVIEAGFPASSPGDFESVQAIAREIKGPIIAGLARTRSEDIRSAAEAVSDADRPRIHTFIATSPIHMEYKLKLDKEGVLAEVRSGVSLAKSLIDDVEFSAEDASRSEVPFLIEVFKTAIECGATTLNIPDTVGYAQPDEFYSFVKEIISGVNPPENIVWSVHCHNDLGLGVANSLAALSAGAGQIECTINGLGERAGNAAMEEIVMGIHTRKTYYGCETNIDTTQIYRSSRLVYNLLGLPPPINKAIVGANAFAHEAGIHQHGVLANRETYEIMTPPSIGLLNNEMVFGKHSGRHAVEKRLTELGYALSKEEVDELFDRFKQLADKKKTINDHDLEALANRTVVDAPAAFKLDRFTVSCGNYVTSSAVVRLNHEEKLLEEVAIGDGPIDAAYNAIDKMIPAPAHILEDYSIFSVTEGNDALGEVIVKIKCGDKNVIGRGLSTDIIEASIMAYVNGLNRLL